MREPERFGFEKFLILIIDNKDNARAEIRTRVTSLATRRSTAELLTHLLKEYLITLFFKISFLVKTYSVFAKIVKIKI